MKRTFGIVIILSTLFITALSGCNEISSTPQLVSKAEGVFSESLAHDESSEAKEAKTEFYIGETAELDKVQTTLIDVTESTGSESVSYTHLDVYKRQVQGGLDELRAYKRARGGNGGENKR